MKNLQPFYMNETAEGFKRFSFDMPMPTHIKLKNLSIKERRSMGHIVNELVEKYLKIN